MRAAVAAILLVLSGPAWGQPVPQFGDYGVGHAEFHHFYNHGERRDDGTMGPLMRNHQPNIKCCEGDCRPTRARKRSGQWEAWVDRKWRPVPAGRVKHNVQSPNGTAHVCASLPPRVEIFCFVKPDLEG